MNLAVCEVQFQIIQDKLLGVCITVVPP